MLRIRLLNEKTVETVVLLSKGEISSKNIRVEFSLYISQIKRKCGLEVGESYNKAKSEDARVPQCPSEKEKAIREAVKYFGMI